jgi:capsular polysaccharide export protein
VNLQVHSDFTRKKLRRVLLLQGPVGPFFAHLQGVLEAAGVDCARVCFNAGDRHFASRRGRINFSGNLAEWRGWLRHHVSDGSIDALVGFGCFRPQHVVARQLAEEAGVDFLSLEEGYLRSGYITAEYGGNNACSPLAGRLPPPDFAPASALLPPPPPYALQSFSEMCRQGALYYAARSLLSHPRERALFHRSTRGIREPLLWARNALRFTRNRQKDFRVIEQLLEHHDGRFFLVPLQVAADSQMGTPALGWSAERLIGEVLSAFARQAPDARRLVFKIHPLERGHSGARRTIMEAAARLGIARRVDVIETGSLGLLIRHAAGVITINSTAGLSAIFHGTPLLVVGQAIYSHPALATCGMGEPQFAGFWNGGPVADARLRHRYLAWIRQEALVPGDFYAADGIPLACAGVMARLCAAPVAVPQMLRAEAGEAGSGPLLNAGLHVGSVIDRYAS